MLKVAAVPRAATTFEIFFRLINSSGILHSEFFVSLVYFCIVFCFFRVTLCEPTDQGHQGDTKQNTDPEKGPSKAEGNPDLDKDTQVGEEPCHKLQHASHNHHKKNLYLCCTKFERNSEKDAVCPVSRWQQTHTHTNSGDTRCCVGKRHISHCCPPSSRLSMSVNFSTRC